LELQDFPYSNYMVESEDGVADISRWVVSQGKEYYLGIIESPNKIPFSKR